MPGKWPEGAVWVENFKALNRLDYNRVIKAEVLQGPEQIVFEGAVVVERYDRYRVKEARNVGVLYAPESESK